MLHSSQQTLTDEALLTKVGHGLARKRVQIGITQEELSRQAGVGKRTVERLETGHSIQMAGFLRVLRVLGLLEELERLVPSQGPTPMELLKLKSKERRRASSPMRGAVKSKAWTWSDSP